MSTVIIIKPDILKDITAGRDVFALVRCQLRTRLREPPAYHLFEQLKSTTFIYNQFKEKYHVNEKQYLARHP